MPDKLADCRTHGIDSELIIVEETLLRAQQKPDETLPMSQSSHSEERWMRARATLKQVLDNAEAQALFTAVELDLEKISILMMPDMDG